MGPEQEPIRIPITDVFDLHSIPPRDVKAVVEEYLREAHRLGFKALRIIHGRGIGLQREMVRSVLARTRFVADFVGIDNHGAQLSQKPGYSTFTAADTAGQSDNSRHFFTAGLITATPVRSGCTCRPSARIADCIL